MDPAAPYSRDITSNCFGDDARIHQGDNHYHSTNEKSREDEDMKCLTDLRITDPRDDKTRIEATKGGLFKDSYRWILEHRDFRQWRDDERSRLLWIKGDPGKGKTMLLCGIVNELSPQTRLQDQKANTLLSYFFCQAADERINSATAVLRGLIYLVVKQQPLLISHIQEKYKDWGEAIFKDVNAWTALSEIFLNILEDLSLEQTYVIIDALDECVTDLLKLLDFISTKSAIFSRVKWIVSSRNWPDIEEGLDSAAQQMRVCLELNEESISAAVDAYINHQVEWLARKKKYNAITKNAVHHHLSSNSNNTFLWVALVCQNLERILLQSPLRTLNKFPPGLDSLYKRMLEQIHDLEDIADTNFCYQILATVLLVYRPVTLAELGSLVKSPDNNPATTELIDMAIGSCGSFLTVRDSRVYVIHQSAKDYLSDKAAPAIFSSSSADVHGVILARSLQAMSVTLRRNIYNIYTPGLPINAIKAPDPDPLAAIQYSCVHWIDHFCDMHNSNSQSRDHVDHKCQEVFLFLRKYFLYWLEALGLMRHIEHGVLLMARLESLLRVSWWHYKK
ncbi:NACHT domain-containing protein [Trichoderma velutinum]